MSQGEKLTALIKGHPVGSTACVLAVAMLGLFLYRHSATANFQATLEEQTAIADRQALNVTYSAQLEEQLTSLKAANQEIYERLVNPQELAINLQYFYRLEAETGVKLADTRPVESAASKTQVGKSYKTVQYAVTLQGSFSQVLLFLRRLEQGASYCRVLSASCSPSQQESPDKKSEAITLSLTVELLGRS